MNRLNRLHFVIFMFVVSSVIFSGCATRGDVTNITTDISSLKKSFTELERKNSVADSLLREQLKLLRSLSADVNYNMGQLGERIQIIEGKLEDLTMQGSPDSYQSSYSDNNVQSETDSTAESKKDVPEISSKQLYNTAYMDYIKGDFKIAVTGFREYLKNNSRTPLSDNAQYHLGECFFNLKQYNDATTAYTNLLKNYSKSEKAPDALLRLVEISLKRKDKKTADRYFKKLQSSFPDEVETDRAGELLSDYNKRKKH
ncbi:MAG: tol-pal system protein YbgF [candidate division Zixibacteria bacterium]|nr:tol-pal system protein YbgF [candidate division Zixibacteria bacterium]